LGQAFAECPRTSNRQSQDFLKKTLNIFAESQTDKALGKDYTLPSANPSTLGKGIFFKKNFLFPFPFS